MKSELQRKVYLSLILLSLIFILCSDKYSENPDYQDVNKNFNIEEFNINELQYKELPYVCSSAYPLTRYYPKDSTGAILFFFENKYYYHPVQLAQRAILFLDGYSLTGDDEYLYRAKLQTNKLLDIAIEIEDAIFFPYPFNFPLHGNPKNTMIAPWYSAMAQGQALSAFIRLYKFTEAPMYLEEARSIFNSFKFFKGEITQWFSMVDNDNYVWFEEYPAEPEPTHALNGFIFAIYGLYEFYAQTEDPECLKLLLGGLTTVKHYVESYRNVGDMSFYCLAHRVKSEKYHGVHIDQMRMLYKITDDMFFKNMADSLFNDYH